MNITLKISSRLDMRRKISSSSSVREGYCWHQSYSKARESYWSYSESRIPYRSSVSSGHVLQNRSYSAHGDGIQ
jgi:hypothetical protein